MPPVWLASYARMLPRLQAERDLRMVNAVAAATGNLKDGKGYVRGLARDAQPSRPVVRSVEGIEAMGITVKKVPKRV